MAKTSSFISENKERLLNLANRLDAAQNQAHRPSLFESMKISARTMTDSEIISKYHWINTSHVECMLSKIRKQLRQESGSELKYKGEE